MQAYILAGGLSSRMGRDKGAIMLGGKMIIEHTIALLNQLKCHTTIISNIDIYNHCGVRIIKDIYEERGPLGGIYSGLLDSAEDRILLLPCDMPLLNESVIHFLIEHANPNAWINVLENQERLHPLIGIYDKKILPILEQILHTDDLKVRSLIQAVPSHIVKSDFATHICANVNTVEDLHHIQKYFES